MNALVPQLTEYDQQVLTAVQSRPRRARDVARELAPAPPASRFWGDVPWMAHGRRVEAETRNVKATLRGLEHLGLVKRSRNGWYRAT